jgi:hypothetical protein
VRRELSDNFCFYEPKYDSIEAASSWAQESLAKHKSDKREHVYTRCAALSLLFWRLRQRAQQCRPELRGVACCSAAACAALGCSVHVLTAARCERRGADRRGRAI